MKRKPSNRPRRTGPRQRSMFDDLPWKVKLRIRISNWWHHNINTIEFWLKKKFPRLINEGEATARVADMAFRGYPMAKDYATKEEAVEHLQIIWDHLDNWDGSRINVDRSRFGINYVPENRR